MLFELTRAKDYIAVRMSPEKALVDRAIRTAKQFLRQCHVAHTEDVTLVLRELANNALEHGCRELPDGVVTCSVARLEESSFRIVVEDEGPGFDFSAISTAVPEDPRRLRNRGYVLIDSLSERLEFSEKGNRVTAWVRVDGGGAVPVPAADGQVTLLAGLSEEG